MADKPETKHTRGELWVLVIGGLILVGLLAKVLDGGRKDQPPSDPAIERKPCGDLAGFHLCADRAVQRMSVSDSLTTTTAGGNAAFVLVHVTLSSEKKRTADLAWPMFELRSSSGRTWEPDVKSQVTAAIGGYQTLDFEQLQPGTAVGGWLVYYVPISEIPDLYLRFTPGLIRSVDVALPPIGASACKLNGEAGVCIEVAKCKGTHAAGLCDGAASVQCCVPPS